MPYDWYEVWTSEATDVPYVLLLLADSEHRGSFTVINPKESNSIVFRTDRYDDAKMWLLEDEFSRVEGRIRPDPPSPYGKVADR